MAEQTRWRRGMGHGISWSWGLLFAVFGVSGCVGQKPPVAPTAEVVHYPRERFQLPNGLQVVVESMPDTGVAGIVLVVGSGAGDEPPSKEGLAHLTEHLVFRARPESGAKRWDRLTYQGGVDVNGGTSWDTTNYSAFVPAPNLARALQLFAEVLTDPLLGVTPADFEHELAIVQNERRLRTENGTPGQGLGWLSKQLFPETHPYARSVAGTQASLDALTLADAQAFATRAYTAPNSTLAVSAPLGVHVRALVEQAFGVHATAGVPQASRLPIALDEEPPPPPAAAMAKHEGLVSNPTLWVGWSLPSSLATRAPIASILTPMAGDTFASNAYSRDTSIGAVSAGYLVGARGDIFYLTATLDRAESAPTALESVVKELRRGFVARQGGNMLQRYKRVAAVRSTYGEELVTTRTFNIAFSEHFQHDPGFISSRDRAILDITPDDLQAYLDTYVTVERARSVLVQPGDVGSLPATPREPLEDRRESAREPAFEASELARWMRPFRGSDATTSKLSNGLHLVVLPLRGAVFHTVLLGFLGGTAAAEAPGVSAAERWAVNKSNWEQSAQGLHHRQPVDPDASMEVLRSTGSNITLTLKALRQELKPAEIFWPPREFVRRLDSYRRDDEAAPQRLQRAEWRALTGDHPYGYYATAEAIRAVSPAQISRWRDLTRRPENALLVVVGNVDPDAVQAAAEAELADWRPPSRPPTPVPPPPALAASPPKFLFQDWPQSSLPRIGLACALPVERRDAFNLLARAIGNHMWGWLRWQLGSSYSTSSWVQWLRGGNAILRVTADVSYEKLPRALAEFERFASPDTSYTLTQAELDGARHVFASSYNLQVDGTSAIAFKLFEQWKLGGPMHELDSVPARVFSTSLADINALAQRCQSHAVLSVLGDRTRIEARLLARSARPTAGN